MNKKPSRLSVIVAMLLLIISNSIICFFVSSVVLIQLISNNCDQYISLFTSFVVSILTYNYIIYNYNIRQFIKKGNSNE